jgi:F0F1-type ATP synthase membrane subunit a
MPSSAFTIKAFGVYVVLTGVGLLLFPNTILGLFGFAPTAEIWIRVVGALAVILGYYYWACAAAGATAFFKASIVGRLGFCALCIGLVAVAGAPLPLLVFGVVDVFGAAWTDLALRRESRA